MKAKKHKHLSFEDRCTIEEFLNNNYNFTQIGNKNIDFSELLLTLMVNLVVLNRNHHMFVMVVLNLILVEILVILILIVLLTMNIEKLYLNIEVTLKLLKNKLLPLMILFLHL